MNQRIITIINEDNIKKQVTLYEDDDIFNLYLTTLNDKKEIIKVIEYSQEELNNEIWKSIKLLPKENLNNSEKIILNDNRKIYISDLGRVMEMYDDEKYYLIKFKNKLPYRELRIFGKDIRIHRLVAYLFISNDDYINKPWVDHIDSNKKYDCRKENLRWCIPMDNSYNKINFDTSKCSTAKKGVIYNNNPIRNKEPKVKLSLDGKTVLCIYENQKQLSKDYNQNEQHCINRCCNKNFKENTNKYNAIHAKWMFKSHYDEYYSNPDNIVTHQIQSSAPNIYKTENIDVNEIIKLKVNDKNNALQSYNYLNLTQNQLDNEIWKLMELPEDFYSDKNGNIDKYKVLIQNSKNKRYFISNLGRIASYSKKDGLVLKSVTKTNSIYSISLFNKLFALNQIIKIFLKGEYIKNENK